MNILVCLHSMELGGSQLNAIELAEVLQERGHQIMVYAPPGVLSQRVTDSGMRLIEAPSSARTPNPGSSMRLLRAVREHNIDVVHAYEWSTIIDTMYGPGWLLGTPVVGTVLSMDVPHFIPTDVPLVLGTRQLQHEQRWRRPDVHLMEPPIDTVLNSPWGGEAVSDARSAWAVSPEEVLIVVVCRLAQRLKLEGLLTAIDVIGSRAAAHKERLLIVGSGPSMPRVHAAAEKVNADAGRQVITLAGELLDPRSAYAAADIVIGMGGSALKGMAFAKPLIVQGEQGFWCLLDESTLPMFSWQGWYGIGRSAEDGHHTLSAILDRLMSQSLRTHLGQLGRRAVCETYTLQGAADELTDLYREISGRRSSRLTRARQWAASTKTLVKRAAYEALQARHEKQAS